MFLLSQNRCIGGLGSQLDAKSINPSLAQGNLDAHEIMNCGYASAWRIQLTIWDDDGSFDNRFLHFLDLRSRVRDIREFSRIADKRRSILVYDWRAASGITEQEQYVSMPTFIRHCGSSDDHTGIVFILEALAEYVHV
jgi:hypothetical protein